MDLQRHTQLLSMESPGQSSKKRKRKRTLVQAEYVEPKDGFGCPFVGYFPTGFDPLKNSDASSSLDVGVYQNTRKFKTKQLQLVASPKEASVDFVGTNYSGETSLWQPCNYLMGVFDKETNTLKLVPISAGKVFRMEARVQGMDYSAADAEEENAELTAEERQRKYQLLTATFGTHKSRLAAKRLDKSRLKEEALGDQSGIGKMFEAAAKSTTVLTNAEALARANANIVRNIPPYDASATKPENIYLLENIIHKDEWDQQPNVGELIAAGTNAQTTAEFQRKADYPLFVRTRIYKLGAESGKRQDRLAHILSYITHLLNFKAMPLHAVKRLLKARTTLEHDTGDKETARLMESSKIPGVTLAKFLKLFSDSKESTRSREKTDLLISYILVLTLMADGFETHPSDIAADLKMIIPDIKSHYLELGCKARGSQNNLKIFLPVPLTFPTMNETIKRRR